MQPLDIGEASEEAGQHLGIIADSKTNLQREGLNSWDQSACIHQCASLKINSMFQSSQKKKTQFKKVQ
jgi:hypothetical protein